MRLLKHLILLLFALVLISSSVFATTLRGSVYDETLNEVDDVFVVVYKNSEPVQRQVTQDGTYEFTLSSGTYLLTARTLSKEPMLGAKVEITIDTEGAFVSDLILEEMSEEEFEKGIQARKNETNQELVSDNNFAFDINFVLVGFALLLAILAFFVLVFFINRKRKKKKKNLDENENEVISEGKGLIDETENGEEISPGQDEESNKVLELIKSEKRITQKEIRNKFDLSEAKISLIITELQNKGYVKRVKKGRGNIIVYNFK
ncbi:MAG: DUF7343 domain-containing protein [Candidatus Nanoarchaeia archaeon]